ncbi:MAG: RDD family protein [Candidatus Aminicenantes bacterium]|jgi:uncharacterized RDD family membrane protein YckC
MRQETISIETPEKIRFDYKIAQTGTRIGAYILDMVIQIVIIILGVLLLVFIGILEGGSFSGRLTGQFQLLALAFFYLLVFFFQWGYFTLFEMFKNGQTPGKKAMRISVIRSNGEPLEASIIVLRNLLRAVDGFPAFYALGGFISILDKKSRRLGDMIADTVVVHEIRFNLKEPPFKTTISSRSTEEPAMKLMTKLNEEELYVIRRFLSDRHLLSEDKQKSVGTKLAANVKKRLNITGDFSNEIAFLERIYKEHSTESQPTPHGKENKKVNG